VKQVTLVDTQYHFPRPGHFHDHTPFSLVDLLLVPDFSSICRYVTSGHSVSAVQQSAVFKTNAAEIQNISDKKSKSL